MKDMADYWQFYLEEVKKSNQEEKKESAGILGSVKSLFSAGNYIFFTLFK